MEKSILLGTIYGAIVLFPISIIGFFMTGNIVLLIAGASIGINIIVLVKTYREYL